MEPFQYFVSTRKNCFVQCRINLPLSFWKKTKQSNKRKSKLNHDFFFNANKKEISIQNQKESVEISGKCNGEKDILKTRWTERKQ